MSLHKKILNDKEFLNRAVIFTSFSGILLTLCLFYVSNWKNDIDTGKIVQTIKGYYFTSKNDDANMAYLIPSTISNKEVLKNYQIAILKQTVQSYSQIFGKALNDDEIEKLVTSTDSYYLINRDILYKNDDIIKELDTLVGKNKRLENTLFFFLLISQIFNTMVTTRLNLVSSKEDK